jgi:NADP-dependent 3-hydroxy acid dehydrogenase YdfG
VNTAGIYRKKPFIDFTTEDFNALVSTNLLGFLYTTQLSVKQMPKQKSGNVVSISKLDHATEETP